MTNNKEILNYTKFFIGILFALSASRFIPHPPNFTSLIALSFYVPAFFGRKYLPAVLFSFVFTDLIIGFHKTTFFTWGSIVLIGYISRYFFKSFLTRISGALLGSIIFFIVTNFGVWLTGIYGYSYSGLLSCYILAIPFFSYNLLSTIIFSSIIEITLKIFKTKKINYKI